LKRARGGDREDTGDVSKEEILDRTTNEYEAIVAIAKEARRLNAVPGVFLEKDERAIPRAYENFVGGKVDYVVEGEECEACAPESGRKKKAVKKSVKKTVRKTAGKGAKKSGKKK
jgi:DNA-directed RNA polymerase subunit K/omega